MQVLVDTGPLVSAIDRRDSAHEVAARLLARLRRNAIVPSPVLVEVDHLARNRVGNVATRKFLGGVAGGGQKVGYMTPKLLRRAVELDNQYADLNLGFVDTCVMAIAERHELPIFTFDFADFRATESASGPWRLLLEEHAYLNAVNQ